MPPLSKSEQEPSSKNNLSSAADPINYNNNSFDIQSASNTSQIDITLHPTKINLTSLPKPSTQENPTSNTTENVLIQEDYASVDHQSKESDSQLILTLYVNQTAMMTRNCIARR